jgi:hypothetical protein
VNTAEPKRRVTPDTVGYNVAFAVAGALVVVSAVVVFLLRPLSAGNTAHVGA